MPADPLTPQEQYVARGLRYAMTKMGRTIKLTSTNQLLHGARTDLQLSSDTPEYGGKKIKRAFQFTITREERSSDLVDGTALTDDLGRKFVVSSVVGDAVSQTITCVGIWG